MKKNIVVLGSTGSIGTQALSVIAAHPDLFETLALSANRSARLLFEQAIAMRARYVGLADSSAARELLALLPSGVRFEAGKDANCALAALPEADIVLICIGGIAGLPALLCALRAGKNGCTREQGEHCMREPLGTGGAPTLWWAYCTGRQ